MRITIRPPADVDLRLLEAEVERAIEQTMAGCAQLIANDAKVAVARGPKTGRIYDTRFVRLPSGAIFPTEKRTPHQASASGEAPATDTGKLVSSIVAAAKGFTAYVEARSVYGVWLEYGTRYMLPRPFLLPAFESNRERCANLIRGAVASAMTHFAQKVQR